MKTFSPRPRHIDRRWYVVDADGAVLGRLASEVAKVLRGKHKPIFAPHVDTGDNVIVINARRVRLTGGKESEKRYHRHSGYPGGLRSVDYTRLMNERPAVAVEKAIRGMLPKNRLGRKMLSKLAVYEGADHPHQAQKPVPLGVGEIPKWEGLPAPKPPPQAVKRAAVPEGTKETKKAGLVRGSTPAKSPAKAKAAAPAKARSGTARAGSSTRRRAKAPEAGGETKKTEAKAGRTTRGTRTTRRSRAKKES